MKLYYTGPGPACTVYVPQGSLTVTVTLRKEGMDYPEGITQTLLRDYPALVSKEEPKLIKVAMPQFKKGGEV